MSRLILFSGGVESTALLTLSTPNDIAFVIRPIDIDTNRELTYKQSSVEAIAGFYGVQLHYASFSIPKLKKTGSAFVHQMKTFIGMSHIMVNQYPDITEVWCGRNCDKPSPVIAPMIEQHMSAWSVLNPNVPFLHPLDHLSKVEQMALIPKEVRQYISSCVTHDDCGHCFKCKEYT